MALIIIAGALFLWYTGSRLFPGYFPFHISDELLKNPPISSVAGIEERIVQGAGPDMLFVNQPFGASNAATSYVEILRSMNARKKQSSPESPTGGSLDLTEDEFQMFLHGVQQADCDFSRESLILDGKPVRLAPAVGISDNLAHLPLLRSVSLAVIARGENFESFGNLDIAVRCYEGVVKFGFDIEKGRESLLQVFTGAAIEKSGAQKLEELYKKIGDTQRAREWSDFAQTVDQSIQKFKDKMIILSKLPGAAPEAVANRLWILEHDKDNMFRREALAGLGAMRVFAPDIIGPALERTAADDPDPYVREAAQNALTQSEIHGTNR